MANIIKFKRGTLAGLNALASGSSLNAGEPYYITDQGRIAIGVTATTFESLAKSSELALKADANNSVLTGSGTAVNLAISGTATAPTAAGGTVGTQLATVGYVQNAFSVPSTSGTLDWNHATQTTPGAGASLLMGSATNGPGGGNYYIPFNLEYGTGSGAGNITQMAFAYGTPGNTMWMRGRYQGNWTSWTQFLTQALLGTTSIPMLAGTSVFNRTSTGSTAVDGRVASNVASFRAAGAPTGAIVFTAPSGAFPTMHELEITGHIYSPPRSVKVMVNGYRFTATAMATVSRTNLGSQALQVRWAIDAAGNTAIILGDVTTVWQYPHIVISNALFSSAGATDAYCTGWTTTILTDISAYTSVLDATETVSAAQVTSALTATSATSATTATSATSATRATWVQATDNRILKPSDFSATAGSGSWGMRSYFSSKTGMDTGTAGSDYGDVISLANYTDTSGGLANALFISKSNLGIFHYQGTWGSTTWNAPKQLAYTDSALTGNTTGSAATLTTARTIGISGAVTGTATSFNGSANITIPITAVDLTSTAYTGILGVDHGSTGQSSYAVGDLLQASGTTALSKLAAVATGNVLLSGGVGVVSSWGKVGLTTHVSGTLPVANGGTGATTAATALTALGGVAKAGDTMTGALNWAPEVTLASASTTSIGVANSNNIYITGTASINSLGLGSNGTRRFVRFASTVQIVPGAFIVLIGNNGAAQITAPGDTAEFLCVGTNNNWIMVNYQRANAAMDGCAATGGGSDRVFYENDQVVNSSYTVTPGRNAMSTGPITIVTGAVVTVGSGSVWTII